LSEGKGQKMNERIPAEVFPPGEYLADEIEARGWTQSEFAEIIRRPIKVVNEIIAGKKAITIETARELSAALGTSPQYWLNLQTAYDLWKTSPSENTRLIARDAWLRDRFPVREMIKRGWLHDSENFEVLEKRVFDFYCIANENEEPQLLHAARRNYREDMTDLQEAWIFRVKQLANALPVPNYSEKKLRDAVKYLQTLMLAPEEVRHVPGVLANCGVRLAIVEPIPNSKIDGVCFWINKGTSPVIGLSMKGDYIDRFWFNLRHEIEHVFRGDGKERIIVDDFESGSLDSKDDAEVAANAQAAEFCVPQKAMNDFIVRHDPMYSTASLVGFSRIMKRHPGIVAGQLQHKIERPELFKKFQPRVRDIITETALTDGYGHEPPSNL
jgi:HTH-type transcriptional regulator/antitoxin HigA